MALLNIERLEKEIKMRAERGFRWASIYVNEGETNVLENYFTDNGFTVYVHNDGEVKVIW